MVIFKVTTYKKSVTAPDEQVYETSVDASPSFSPSILHVWHSFIDLKNFKLTHCYFLGGLLLSNVSTTFLLLYLLSGMVVMKSSLSLPVPKPQTQESQ